MDEKQELKAIIGAIILIVLLWTWQNYRVINNLKEENTKLESQVEEQLDQINDYRDALDQANSNIDEANSEIEEAQGYVWGNYHDMGTALENLYTIDTINEL